MPLKMYEMFLFDFPMAVNDHSSMIELHMLLLLLFLLLLLLELLLLLLLDSTRLDSISV